MRIHPHHLCKRNFAKPSESMFANGVGSISNAALKLRILAWRGMERRCVGAPHHGHLARLGARRRRAAVRRRREHADEPKPQHARVVHVFVVGAGRQVAQHDRVVEAVDHLRGRAGREDGRRGGRRRRDQLGHVRGEHRDGRRDGPRNNSPRRYRRRVHEEARQAGPRGEDGV